jgi:hypothetical protein
MSSISASVDSILSSSTAAPQVVTASVGTDGNSIDASTSTTTGGSPSATAATGTSSTDVTKNEFLQ